MKKYSLLWSLYCVSLHPLLDNFVKVTDCVHCISPVVVIGPPAIKKMHIHLFHCVDILMIHGVSGRQRRGWFASVISALFTFGQFSVGQNHGSSYILIISMLDRVLHFCFVLGFFCGYGTNKCHFLSYTTCICRYL